ncbi:MAG: hypothetical protein RDV41_13785 [Planctomycetota bacterium]|nr:hypothetical protein [Planctomycetota bacterium]
MVGLFLLGTQVSLAQDGPGTIVLAEGWTAEVVVDNIPGTGPAGMAVGPDGALYIAPAAPSSTTWFPLLRYDPATGLTQHGNPIHDPDPVVLGSDGNLYVGARNGICRVAPDGATALFAVDPANVGKKYPTTGLLANVDGLALRADGRLYGTTSIDTVHSSVACVDSAGHPSLFVMLTFRPANIRFAPIIPGWEHSGQLFITDRTYGRVIVADPDTGTLSTFADDLASPADIEFDRDDLSVYVTDAGRGIVYQIAQDGARMVIASGLLSPNFFMWDGAGRLLVSEATGFRIVALKKADTTTPTLTVGASPSQLWPPNHKLVRICITIDVFDAVDPAPLVELVSVTSSEPDNGLGDGDTPCDIVTDVQGSLFLRAERGGSGPGRIYTITYITTDKSGNSTQAAVEVRVLHDQGK